MNDSVNVLVDEVYIPVFFSKLAAVGFTADTSEQAGTLLEIAARLRLLKEASAIDSAAAADNIYKVAADSLNQVLPLPDPVSELSREQLADSLLSQPHVYASALNAGLSDL